MFTSVHLLPQYDVARVSKYKDRWLTGQGLILKDKILSVVKKGGGQENFAREIKAAEAGFFEHPRDLKGLIIKDELITFPNLDNFEGINFSYCQFKDAEFNNAVFNCNFGFAKIYNCKFVNCVFSFESFYSSFYGTSLAHCQFINCDFYEHNTFTNCELEACAFKNCFMVGNMFEHCKFDQQTRVGEPIEKPNRVFSKPYIYNKLELAELYKNIADAYNSGGAAEPEQEYFLKAMKAVTRYNTQSFLKKAKRYFLELVTGYGVKPLRVFFTLALVCLLSFLIFASKVGVPTSLMLTTGGLFTFGASTDTVRELGVTYELIYIATAFAGLSLTALFITILANVWFREK